MKLDPVSEGVSVVWRLIAKKQIKKIKSVTEDEKEEQVERSTKILRIRLWLLPDLIIKLHTSLAKNSDQKTLCLSKTCLGLRKKNLIFCLGQ